jgi:hypothetical protein
MWINPGEMFSDRQDGTDVERGMAAELDAGEGSWIYTATQPVPMGTDIFIELVGLDRAGSPCSSTAHDKNQQAQQDQEEQERQPGDLTPRENAGLLQAITV